MCLGHALSRHGHVQPTSSTAPMGLPQLNDKVAMIQRAGCVFLDHVLVTKEFQASLHVCPEWLLCVWTQYIQAVLSKDLENHEKLTAGDDSGTKHDCISFMFTIEHVLTHLTPVPKTL